MSMVMSRCQSRCRSRYRSILSFLVLASPPLTIIRDDVKPAQLVRARVSPEVVSSIQKPENSNLHGFEVHRPSSKGTKLLLQIIKAIIQKSTLWEPI